MRQRQGVESDSTAAVTPATAAPTDAPPFDLSGNTATSFPGVGTHQVHLAGSTNFRAVACSDCHQGAHGGHHTGPHGLPAASRAVPGVGLPR
ncbi:MAG: hypothetical protein R3B07_22900 [Polyangiaceae bacterium]